MDDVVAKGLDVVVDRTYVIGSIEIDGRSITGHLRLLDVRNPDKPVLIGHIDDLVEGDDIAVREPYLYVADGRGGLQILRLVLPYRANLAMVSRQDQPKLSNIDHLEK
jgi:hypothetical protein